jgi:hypothetical protein
MKEPTRYGQVHCFVLCFDIRDHGRGGGKTEKVGKLLGKKWWKLFIGSAQNAVEAHR